MGMERGRGKKGNPSHHVNRKRGKLRKMERKEKKMLRSFLISFFSSMPWRGGKKNEKIKRKRRGDIRSP